MVSGIGIDFDAVVDRVGFAVLVEARYSEVGVGVQVGFLGNCFGPAVFRGASGAYDGGSLAG